MECIFKDSIISVVPKVALWRHHLHANPEPSFAEFSTTEYIIEQIKDLPDIVYTRPLATGLVATLDTGKPGPTIALRADIDALKIQEDSGVPFTSKVDGVMHACGHDAHTAMLIGVMHVMCERRAELTGKFVFIFQPAEEDPPGGAKPMVEKGVLEGVDAIIGQHVASIVDVGKVEVSPGFSAANTDTFTIKVIGKSGHASRPQKCLDPIPVAAEIVTALQQIVARFVPPTDPAVLSITYVQSGTTHNIIPDEAVLKGTVRSFAPEVRSLIEEKIKSISTGIAAAVGLEAQVNYERGYDALYNDEKFTNAFIAMADDLYGAGTCFKPTLSMGGEDFSAYLQKVPGCFYHIGSASDKMGARYIGHSCHFIIDEDMFPMGITLMINGALLFQKLVERK